MARPDCLFVRTPEWHQKYAHAKDQKSEVAAKNHPHAQAACCCAVRRPEGLVQVLGCKATQTQKGSQGKIISGHSKTKHILCHPVAQRKEVLFEGVKTPFFLSVKFFVVLNKIF